MNGRKFIIFARQRGIPLSCIADKLDCNLTTLRRLEGMEEVPDNIMNQFIKAYKSKLHEEDILLLSREINNRLEVLH